VMKIIRKSETAIGRDQILLEDIYCGCGKLIPINLPIESSGDRLTLLYMTNKPVSSYREFKARY